MAAFVRNNDFQAASSLAFTTSLALVPSLLLLTWLLGLGLGSSPAALARTELVVHEVLPHFGDVILREVSHLARHAAVAGTLNILALVWSVVPLVSGMRSSLAAIFRTGMRHPLWLSTVFDLLTGILFVTGVAAVAALGVALTALKGRPAALIVPAWLGVGVPFACAVFLLVLLYYVLAPKVRPGHLLAGSLTAAVLWFLMRPAFGLFLTFNPGYGVAFGSFKSLFVVIIWVYASQAVFLLGAEVIAALHRKDAILIRRLMDGKGGVPSAGRARFVVFFPAGSVLFHEGDEGHEAYFVLKGTVSVRKEGHEISTIGERKLVGEMSFLLGQPRSATAVAVDSCECIRIDDRNAQVLMREFPETVREMLREMAARLSATSSRVGGVGG